MATPHVRRLACGMPLVVEEIPGVRSAGVTWLVSGGTSREPEAKQGLGAMWSEILFRGAGDLDSRAHADALDRLGVSRSGRLGTFHMKLGMTLLGEKMDDALPLLVDMVRRPRMDEASVEPVRDLSIQSIEALDDEPQERVMLSLRARHNPPPFNRSDLGTIEGLKSITRGDLVDGWSGMALPRGSILGVAGHVDADRLEARLNELLDGWEGESKEATAAGKAARGYEHEDDDTNQVHIAVAHDSPREADERSLLERVVTAALSGGMSGRLFSEVREKRGLVYSVYAAYRADRDFGRTVAYAGTTPERAQETLDVLLHELRRINGAEGISQSEFDRAVVGMKSKLVMSGESTSARAGAIAGDFHKLGRPRSLEEMAAA
ncbi:MAG: pitrilysin family protein, partial [Planctomycetota bacterium]|nr:pitrilysin family protein [Planctomycetota bacterium]